jgi:stress response protein SCP2
MKAWGSLRVVFQYELAPTFDVDLFSIVLGSDGRCLGPEHVVFYGNVLSPRGAVTNAGGGLFEGAVGCGEVVWVSPGELPLSAGAVQFVLGIQATTSTEACASVLSSIAVEVTDMAQSRKAARHKVSGFEGKGSAVAFGKLTRSTGWAFEPERHEFENIFDAVRSFGLVVS